MKNDIKYYRYNKKTLIPIKNITTENKSSLKKPEWMKIKLQINSSYFHKTKAIIHKNGLHSICEEASCPNLTECFNRGATAFMILGDICTRRCPFCNVKHGRPIIPDTKEPLKLAQAISYMNLRYVVITSVNRDDLYDGGAQHFANCIAAIREKNPNTKIEILVPDFRNSINYVFDIFRFSLPDVFNHNIENVPRLYSQIRPGSNYNRSLRLLKHFKDMYPEIPTKSGLMLGLGETDTEIIEVMRDLRFHGVTMLTIGQYLQPSSNHLPVQRYISPDEFYKIKTKAISMGFTHAACGPFVRSSYYADRQSNGEEIN